MKNSNDTTGNRTRDLPVCSAVPQPTIQIQRKCLAFTSLAKISSGNPSTDSVVYIPATEGYSVFTISIDMQTVT